MEPKCAKCGGDLGKSVEAFITHICPKCAGMPVVDPVEWQSKLILPDYLKSFSSPDSHEDTATWWSLKTEFVSFPKFSNIHQTIGIPWLPGEIDFGDGYNSDETLAALGRAFDDAIDLASLG